MKSVSQSMKGKGRSLVDKIRVAKFVVEGVGHAQRMADKATQMAADKISDAITFVSDNLPSQQPDPVGNEQPAVWATVIEYMKARNKVGKKRYGVELQPHNGREPLDDAFDEALDLCAYLCQEREERRVTDRVIADLAELAEQSEGTVDVVRLRRILSDIPKITMNRIRGLEQETKT